VTLDSVAEAADCSVYSLYAIFGSPDAPSVEETVAELYKTTSATLTREPRMATAMLSHVEAGRIRDISTPLLLQQLLGPMLAHVLMRPALAAEVGLDQACSEFTAAFLRAVGTSNYVDIEGR
jgi:hypothetical protein